MNINSTYFEWHGGSSLSGMQSGDIVAFNAHTAYVVSVGNPIDNTRVDQVPYEGGPEQTNVLLSTVKQTQGNPTGYWSKKPIWNVTVQNSFSGGKVGVNGTEWDSPKTVGPLHWESTLNIDAVMDGRVYDGCVQQFQEWQKIPSGQVPTTKAATIAVTEYSFNISYTARLEPPSYTVSISGPDYIPPQTITLTAKACGGTSPYSYAWYHKWVCDGGEGPGPDIPCDTWTQVGSNSPTLQFYVGGNSAFRVDVTDALGSFVSDEHYVYVYGYGRVAKLVNGSSTATFAQEIPTSFTLGQNHPNPFNPATAIRFQLPEPSQVLLIVYDIFGREMAELVDGKLEAGYRRVSWNAIDYPSGIYFYRLVAVGESGSKFSKTLKMVFAK